MLTVLSHNDTQFYFSCSLLVIITVLSIWLSIMSY